MVLPTLTIPPQTRNGLMGKSRGYQTTTSTGSKYGLSCEMSLALSGAQQCSRRRRDSADWALAEAFLALPEASYTEGSTKTQPIQPENKLEPNPVM